jgi:hypothetical protein
MLVDGLEMHFFTLWSASSLRVGLGQTQPFGINDPSSPHAFHLPIVLASPRPRAYRDGNDCILHKNPRHGVCPIHPCSCAMSPSGTCEDSKEQLGSQRLPKARCNKEPHTTSRLGTDSNDCPHKKGHRGCQLLHRSLIRDAPQIQAALRLQRAEQQ